MGAYSLILGVGFRSLGWLLTGSSWHSAAQWRGLRLSSHQKSLSFKRSTSTITSRGATQQVQRSQWTIFLHLIAIAKDRAYLDSFYRAKTWDDKAVVLDDYARTKLDMTADVNIKDDDPKYFAPHPQSPLCSKYCEVTNEAEDSRILCQDCMCHFCNKYCLHDNKKNQPRTCRMTAS